MGTGGWTNERLGGTVSDTWKPDRRVKKPIKHHKSRWVGAEDVHADGKGAGWKESPTISKARRLIKREGG